MPSLVPPVRLSIPLRMKQGKAEIKFKEGVWYTFNSFEDETKAYTSLTPSSLGRVRLSIPLRMKL